MVDKNNLMICIEAWECHTDVVTLKELTGMNKDEFFSTARLFDDVDLISQDYFEGYTLDEAIREAKAYAKRLPKPRVERKSYSSNRPEEVVFTYVSLLIYDEDYDNYESLSTMFDTYDLNDGLYTNAIAAGVTERYDPYFDADIDTSNFTPQTPVPLKSLKNGEYFTLKDIPQPKDSQVWVKGEWDKWDKEWICYKFSDISNGKGFPGNKMVYVDFIF